MLAASLSQRLPHRSMSDKSEEAVSLGGLHTGLPQSFLPRISLVTRIPLLQFPAERLGKAGVGCRTLCAVPAKNARFPNLCNEPQGCPAMRHLSQSGE